MSTVIVVSVLFDFLVATYTIKKIATTATRIGSNIIFILFLC